MGNFLHDIHQLEAFRSLVQTRSFTVTARELHVTQAAISYSIKKLEKSLGCKLFRRGARDVSLTKEGQLLLPHCTVILQRISLAEEEITGVKKWGSGKLRLGGSEAVCEYLLHNLLREFQENFPDVKIDLVPANTDKLLQMLDSGEIDLAIGVQMAVQKKSPYVFYKLFNDEKKFIVSATHPWAQKESITEEDIEKECIITATRHGKTKEKIVSYLDTLGTKVERLIEVYNVDIQKKMVGMNLGVGIASCWMLIDEISSGELIAHSIPRKPILREWGIMANRDHALSMYQQAFVRMLREAVKDYGLDESGQRDIKLAQS
ncbi:MAG: LysR family transcriptional regulator [Akkermansiaceae bacterium]